MGSDTQQKGNTTTTKPKVYYSTQPGWKPSNDKNAVVVYISKSGKTTGETSMGSQPGMAGIDTSQKVQTSGGSKSVGSLLAESVTVQTTTSDNIPAGYQGVTTQQGVMLEKIPSASSSSSSSSSQLPTILQQPKLTTSSDYKQYLSDQPKSSSMTQTYSNLTVPESSAARQTSGTVSNLQPSYTSFLVTPESSISPYKETSFIQAPSNVISKSVDWFKGGMTITKDISNDPFPKLPYETKGTVNTMSPSLTYGDVYKQSLIAYGANEPIQIGVERKSNLIAEPFRSEYSTEANKIQGQISSGLITLEQGQERIKPIFEDISQRYSTASETGMTQYLSMRGFAESRKPEVSISLLKGTELIGGTLGLVLASTFAPVTVGAGLFISGAYQYTKSAGLLAGGELTKKEKLIEFGKGSLGVISMGLGVSGIKSEINQFEVSSQISKGIKNLPEFNIKNPLKEVQLKEGQAIDSFLTGTRTGGGFTQDIKMYGKFIQKDNNQIFMPSGQGESLIVGKGIKAQLDLPEQMYVNVQKFSTGIKGFSVPESETMSNIFAKGIFEKEFESSALIKMPKTMDSKFYTQLKTKLTTNAKFFEGEYTKIPMAGVSKQLTPEGDLFITKSGRITNIGYEPEYKLDVIPESKFIKNVYSYGYEVKPTVFEDPYRMGEVTYFNKEIKLAEDVSFKRKFETYLHERGHTIGREFYHDEGLYGMPYNDYLKVNKELKNAGVYDNLKRLGYSKFDFNSETFANVYKKTAKGFYEDKGLFTLDTTKFHTYSKYLQPIIDKEYARLPPKGIIEQQIRGVETFESKPISLGVTFPKTSVVRAELKDVSITKIIPKSNIETTFDITSKGNTLSMKGLSSEIQSQGMTKSLIQESFKESKLSLPVQSSLTKTSSIQGLSLASTKQGLLSTSSLGTASPLKEKSLSSQLVTTSPKTSNRQLVSSLSISDLSSSSSGSRLSSSSSSGLSSLSFQSPLQEQRLVQSIITPQPQINKQTFKQNFTGFSPPSFSGIGSFDFTGSPPPVFAMPSIGDISMFGQPRKRKKRKKVSAAPSFTAEAFGLTGAFPKSSAFGISPFSLRTLPKRMKGFM